MRFVVDERALECNDLPSEVVRESFYCLTDCLLGLRDSEGEEVGILSGWGEIACWEAADLASVLSSDLLLGRDERVLLLGLLGKCAHIDDEAQDCDPVVTVAQSDPESSYGIALAHAGYVGAPPTARAVVSLQHVGRVGELTVLNDGLTARVLFLVDASDERLLWRALYEVDGVAEADFFDVAVRAFPDLLFANGLSFRRFAGGYASVCAAAARHLGALNDAWSTAYADENGNAEAISTRIGVDVSKESANTRASPTLMRERDVEYEGQTYRCEWHTKLEPTRNRIHFHPAAAGLSGPLVGIFCEHLPT